MATLQFKGKSIIWNNHLSVPYQTLEEIKTKSHKGKNKEDNLIIEGDNLVALKSLLPKYQGKIKCIYIDPPYNTGNEGWVYNDNVNNPLIKEWIGKVVGKEGEDFTRHDKWLCMMTPRLKLLRELLSDDGVIFISIDENEIFNLKILMENIFNGNYLGNISVVNNWKGRSDDEYIATCNEYLLVFAKNKSNFEMGGFPLSEEDLKEYDQEDEYGKFKEVGYRKTGKGWRKEDRPNMYYPVYYNPKTQEISLKNNSGFIEILPKTKSDEDGRWRWGKDTFEKRKNKDIVIRTVRGGQYRVFTKMRLNESDDEEERTLLPKSTWIDTKYDSTKGSQVLKELLNTNKDLFENPKPISFVKDILLIATNKDSIILDSFAGSGTTAQAVMELNKEDEGNRKFILVQIPEEIKEDAPAYQAGYKSVQEITKARVEKVIERDNLDVGFTYYKLGKSIDAESILGGDLPSYEEFSKYVYYLATGKNFDSKIDKKNYFVGKNNSEAIFLIYEEDFEKLKNTALNLDIAKKINEKYDGRKIVYAPACYLDDEYLEQYNITFVGIPFNLFERK